MAALLEVFCLGDFKARLDGVAIPALANSKPLALWVYVALAGAERSRAHLAELFWSELDEEAARVNLRLALLRLRGLIPEHIVVTRASVRVPQESRFFIDAAVRPTPDDLSRASVDALLLRKPEEFLAGPRLRYAPQFDDWVSTERQRLVTEHVSALAQVAQQLVAKGEAERAVDVYRRCLSLVPWSEENHRALIRCYAELGQRTAALAQFDACRRVLRRELDVEPDAVTCKLIDSIRSMTGEAEAATSIPATIDRSRAGTLDPLAPLVNRTRERDYLARLLLAEGCRLVSIVGPGGVGKTHLAQHVGEMIGRKFRDGMCFVPLADVQPQLPGQSTSLVESRIAEALGLAGGGSSTRAALLAALAEREVLLVLDNFEQLAEAAGLIEAITLRAPRVRILVTSRHRLELPTEWVMRLEGLDYPEDSRWADASLAYPAVELFVKVAQRIEVGFDASANGVDILRICRAVAGYPLAITLAARWLATLTCREIAARLSESMSLLSEERHPAAPARHQSLAAVFDQSWALLSEAEQAAFSGLSVFRGGFTVTAAKAVVQCDLAAVDGLVNKSLLRRRPDDRLEIHELMRDLGAAKLDRDPGRARGIRERHANYYESLLRDELARFEVDPLRAAFEHTRQELGNLLAAFEYRLARGEVEPLAALLRGLWVFHKRLGWFADGAVLLRRALGLPALPLEHACRWRLWLSDASFQLARHDECKEAVLASLGALGEPIPAPGAAGRYILRELLKQLLPARWISLGAERARLRDDVARTHNRLAQVYFFEGERHAFLASTLRSMNVAAVSEAVEHWASGALALAHTPLRWLAARYARRAERSIDRAEPFARAWAHEQLGLYALGIGDYVNSERHTDKGAKLYWELGQCKYWGECATLNVYHLAMRGDLAGARERFGENLRKSRERRERFAEVWALCGLAHIELRAGQKPSVDLGVVDSVIGDLVDPNTALLYFGNAAWAAARRGDSRATLEAIGTCHRVTERATMLSIYALNGFIAQVMALVELAARPAPDGPGPDLGETAATVLRDFKRFAAPFPAAWPYVQYLEGRWLLENGRSARGEALCAKALARLALVVEPQTFVAGFDSTPS